MFTAQHNCDSIVTLQLTIKPTSSTDFTDEACDTYTWNGMTYTTSGDYTQTFQNVYGCDSVVTLHLTIHNSVSSDFTISCPDSCYIWNGVTYCESGDYTQTFQTVNGCDSVVTLHLALTVGVSDYDTEQLTVYPNPTTGQVAISHWPLAVSRVEVYDVYGKLLNVVPGEKETTLLNLEHYATGTYLLRLFTNKGVMTRKVVRQ